MDEIKAARLLLKSEMANGELWPGTRCACGEFGATDLGHIVYTRHPDSVDLYHEYNMCLLHNGCNTTGESLGVNINACLILLARAGGVAEWLVWARALPRKGAFWIPEKMRIAMDLWNRGVRPFEFERIYLTVDRPLGGGEDC